MYVHMTFCNTLQNTATHCNTPCLQPIDNVLDEALAVREMRLNPEAFEFAGDAAECGQNVQETAVYGDEKMLDETHSKMLRLMADLHAGRIDRILKEERELVALLVKLRHKRYRIPRPDILSGLCSVCGSMIGSYMTRSDSERHSHGQPYSRWWPSEGLFPQMIRIHTDSFADSIYGRPHSLWHFSVGPFSQVSPYISLSTNVPDIYGLVCRNSMYGLICGKRPAKRSSWVLVIVCTHLAHSATIRFHNHSRNLSFFTLPILSLHIQNVEC